MRAIYFDCFSGISGDMTLGALVDAGVPKELLVEELRKIPGLSFALKVNRVKRGGLAASSVTVVANEEAVERSLADILALLEESSVEGEVQSLARSIFQRLAAAEAAVHAAPVEDVHFHEVGGVDAIVDIVGTVLGVRYLGVERLFCSSLPMGRGTVRCTHGVLPLPAPAVAEMMRGLPTAPNPPLGSGSVELVTPTGAAIVVSLCNGFGDMPPMRVEAVGYGAGKRELETPNLLRIFVGELASDGPGPQTETVAILEANIDDMNPEIYSHLIERLLKKGALDVFVSPLIMKKGRPGQLLSVLCRPEEARDFAALLFRETTTFGVRVSQHLRFCLARETRMVETRFGPIAMKIAFLDGEVVQASPEFRDCREAAQRFGAPLKEVYAAAAVAFGRQGPAGGSGATG